MRHWVFFKRGLGPWLVSTACFLLAAQHAHGQLWSPEIDLNEKIWLDWNAASLPLGQVSTWSDAAGGVAVTQANVAERPVKTEAGLEFGTGVSNLWGPNFSQAGTAHRAAVMIFKADLSTATFDSGSFFSANGYQGSLPHRVPQFGYSEPTNSYTATWTSTPGSSIRLPAGDPDDWHVLISRRVGGKHYASIDGHTELVADVENLVVGRDNINAPSIIGDYRPNSIDWTLNRLMVLQDELQDHEVDNIAGWAMWEMGMQDNLPSDHPYRLAPPQTNPYVNPYVGNTAEDWQQIDAWWDEVALKREKERFYGQPIQPLLQGYQTVFEDHFTSMTVTDERTGEGPWYAPVHPAANGSAQGQRPGDSPSVYSQSGSELTITMKQSGGRWYSGAITTVNLDGRGESWNPAEHPTYFEARMKATAGNGVASWPAFWIKDVNEFFMRTVPRTEIDIYEGYNADPDGHHQAYHNWPADRNYGDRLDTHEIAGNYTGLSSSWPDAPVDLFDGEFHTYGALIDGDWLIYTFDGLELMRAPVRPDMLRPMYMLIDLALLPSQAAQASGEYELTIDYVRVMQDLSEPTLPGDYNDDGIVNAADYSVWRDQLGAPAGTLPNDADGGTIGQAQYQTWRANYGAESGLPAEPEATPEPATLLQLVCLLGLVGGSRRLDCERIRGGWTFRKALSS